MKETTISFLTEEAQKELLRMYKSEIDDENNIPAEVIASYCMSRCELPFSIPEQVFNAIDEIMEAEHYDLNVWFSVIHGFKRNGIKYIWITFDIEDRDPEYMPDGNISTKYWIEQINKNTSNNFELYYGGYGFMQAKMEIKEE